MLASLSAVVDRHAVAIAAAWVGLAVLLTLLAPGLQDVATLDDAALLPEGSASQRAAVAIEELFPADPGRNVALVSVSRDGGLAPGDREFLNDLVSAASSQRLGFVPERVQAAAQDPALAPLLRSPDGAAELALIELAGSPFEARSADAVEALRGYVAQRAPAGLQAHVTGLAGIGRDQASAILESIDRTALITIVLILVILLAVYRAPVAALIPLATIGASFLVSRALIALLAEAGWTVAGTAETFMIVLVFGAGTDYTLFLVSRFREEAGASEASVALRRTVVVIGAVLAAAAATVIVGFASMLSAEFGMYRTTGPSVALAIAVTLAAGLTLTPALLRLAGRWAFWPGGVGGQAHGQRARRRWEWLAGLVRRWPAEVLLAGTTVLLLPAAGLGWFTQSFDLVGDLPASADSRQGFEALSEHYPGGTLAPIHLLIRHDQPIRDPAVFTAIDGLTERLRDEPGVGTVRSITQPAGAPLTLDTVDRLTGTSELDLAAIGLDPDRIDLTPLFDALASPEGLRFTPQLFERYPPIAQRVTPFFEGADGRSTRLIVELAGNPFTSASLDTISAIDQVAVDTLAGSALAGAEVLAGGPASFYVDIQQVNNRDFTVILVVLLLGTFLVLAALVRALVAPLYLLATVLLSYAATLGLTVLVSGWLLGVEGMAFWVPPFLLVILVALGADYNIFIVSRIREELDAGHSVTEAATRGLVLTGGVITSAGLILAGTFAALMVAPMPNLRQVGFAVTVGILLDTFLVRSILVPAATILLGRWAFWPSRPGETGAGVAAHRPGRRPAPALAAVAGLVVVVLAASVLPGVASQPLVVASTPSAASIDQRPNANGQGAPAPDRRSADEPAPQGPSPSSAPTSSPSAVQTPDRGAANPPADVEPSGPTPQASSGSGSSSPHPSPSPKDEPQTSRIAVPATGGWRYHTQGTRKIGAAGSEQPFDEDVTTEVSRVGGTDRIPHLRLVTESSGGTQDDRRQYAPEIVELHATHQSSGPMSFGGQVEPPLPLLRWPMQVGDRWTHRGTVGGSTRTDSTFEVTGTDQASIDGTTYTCWIVASTTTLSGDVDGRNDEQTCWAVELGMSAWSVRDSQGTYNGVSFDIHTETRLLATP